MKIFLENGSVSLKYANFQIEQVEKHYNISFGQSRISLSIEESAVEGQVVGQIQAEVTNQNDAKGLR